MAFMIGWQEEVLRIILGALLGGLVGLDREIRGQAAGLRTHTLVAMGATLFTLVSLYGFTGFEVEGEETVALDPSRVASQIVVGIGFLGAGAIMRHGPSVKGLTTAASLWVVAALGMSVGVGYYLGAVTIAVLLLIILRVLRPAEDWLVGWVRPDEATLTIHMESNKTNSHNILGLLEEKKIRVREVNIDSTPEATVLRLIVKLPGKMKAEQVVEDLSGASGVTGAHWKR
ncbi:MAG: MgtC/SapB family protein [Thermoleophilia bacterium]